MKLEWMDKDKTKVAVTLDQGETLNDFVGPGRFQLVANDLNSDFTAVKDKLEDKKDEAKANAKAAHAAGGHKPAA